MKTEINNKMKSGTRLGLRILLILTLTINQNLLGPVLNAQGSKEPVLLNDRAADIIGAHPMGIPKLISSSGLSGQGVTIALADSGLDKGSLTDIHPDLATKPGDRPRVAMLRSFSGRKIADDPNGHGTHMAATIVGNGQESKGRYRGLAPGATLYFQGLLDENDNLKIPAQLNELFLPAYAAGARIHVNGWGGGSNVYGSHAYQIDRFVNNYPDFLPIFGAGNSGPQPETLSSAANSKNALIVGSSQLPRPSYSSEAQDADKETTSSSRGPADGNRIKPDLLAPGSAIISACSSLVKGNYPANGSYTTLGGSSMAAAVAGGATALLYEYLQKNWKIEHPSSALLKSLLINGARRAENDHEVLSNFGILDISSTIIALKENCFQFVVPGASYIEPAQSLEYRFSVNETDRMFKATLVWVDQPKEELDVPMLINDLDLIIEDPMGHIYYGNDFLNKGDRDDKNNVEQISIAEPIAGEYKITLSAKNLKQSIAAEKIALAYGQVLKHGIFKNEDQGKIELANGEEIDRSDYISIYSAIDEKLLISDTKTAIIGSDVLLAGDKLYLIARSWLGEGIQILDAADQPLMVEMNPDAREGGYYLDKDQNWPNSRTLLNKERVESLADIPNGTQIHALINPTRQTIWDFNANYRVLEGIISKVDSQKRELKLVLNDKNTYTWSEDMAVGWYDDYLNLSPEDSPYGSLEAVELEKLLPSMKVTLFLAPDSDKIIYIRIHRYIAMGVIAGVDLEKNNISLSDGRVYDIMPGATIMADGEIVNLKELPLGSRITLLLLERNSPVIQVQSFSQVLYGKLIYASIGFKQLYLLNNKNQFQNYELAPDIEVFRNGTEIGNNIEAGSWVRILLNPKSGLVQRIDVATVADEEQNKNFASFNALEKTMTMRDGSIYHFDDYTNINKSGIAIRPDLLISGEQVKITTLMKIDGTGEYLCNCQSTLTAEFGETPISATASLLNGVLVIRGTAPSSSIYIYRQNEKRIEVPVNNDESFSLILLPDPGEEQIRILGVNARNGAIGGIDIPINDITPPALRQTYFDIDGHEAQSSIESLSERGIIRGYEDATFRPDENISRSEFITILGRAWEWQLKPGEKLKYFADNAEIPVWATEAIYYGRNLGIINGYPDGTLRPLENISRMQALVLADKIISQSNNISSPGLNISKIPYYDRGRLPSWGEDAVLRLYSMGILDAVWKANYLEPETDLSRAEAAMIIAAMLKYQEGK